MSIALASLVFTILDSRFYVTGVTFAMEETDQLVGKGIELKANSVPMIVGTTHRYVYFNILSMALQHHPMSHTSFIELELDSKKRRKIKRFHIACCTN